MLPLPKVPLISPLTVFVLCFPATPGGIQNKKKKQILYNSVFWFRRAVQAGAAAQSSHVSDLEVLMDNIKSPGSSPFRFALAEKCYSCSTLSPISLYHNSSVHFSNEGWCEGGGGGCSRKAVPHQ